MPTDEGSFYLYTIKDGPFISEYWYVSMVDSSPNLEKELADVRVLLELCSQGQEVECSFIIVTNEDLVKSIPPAKKAFDKMKTFLKPNDRELFDLEVWDKNGLLLKEKELGIKVDLK